MILRIVTTILLALVSTFAAVMPRTAALAAVGKLNPQLIRDSELPTYGFVHSHAQSYAHFTRQMVVTTHAGPGDDRTYCYVPAAFAHLGWQQGVIQSFDRGFAFTLLRVCGFRFAADKGAHQAYNILTTGMAGVIKSGDWQRVTRKHVGDESSVIGQSQRSGNGNIRVVIQSYRMVFRYRNVVIEISYANKTDVEGGYSSNQFVSLGAHLQSRLRMSHLLHFAPPPQVLYAARGQ
jgi:hypothetical protein